MLYLKQCKMQLKPETKGKSLGPSTCLLKLVFGFLPQAIATIIQRKMYLAVAETMTLRQLVFQKLFLQQVLWIR